VDEFCSQGLRAEFDGRSEKLGYKIREAQLSRTPYIVIIGDNEVAENKIAIRMRGGAQKSDLPRDEFIKNVVEEVNSRSLEPHYLDLEN